MTEKVTPLIVIKLDRLARSTADLYKIITELSDKGVGLKVLDDGAADTTTRTGKLVMGILELNCRVRDGDPQRASDGRYRKG